MASADAPKIERGEKVALVLGAGVRADWRRSA